MNLLQADYDNDGHLDVLVLRGAGFLAIWDQPPSLLRNRGDISFEDQPKKQAFSFSRRRNRSLGRF
jgi:hypothetical protein